MIRTVHASRTYAMQHAWTLGLIAILVLGGLLRLTGFQVGLPYFVNADEPWLYYEAAFQRGLITNWLHPNPSQGLTLLFIAAQRATELITGQSALDHTATIFAAMRFFNVFLSLGTLVALAYAGRELAGRAAGLLAALVWALIPLVIYHSFIAIAEPWMMLFAALCLYSVIRAMNYQSGRWALVSVWMGLFGFAFKYSMFPFPGLGLAAAVWFWVTDRPRRPYWGKILLAQIGSIAGFLAFLVLFGGLAQSIDSPDREVRMFLNNPFARLSNLNAIFHPLMEAFPQFNTSAWVVGMVVLSALIILISTRQPLARVYLWIILSLFGAGLAVLVALYVYVPGTLERYLFAANMVFILLGTGSLVILWNFSTEWLSRRGVGRYSQIVLPAAGLLALLVWLLPLGVQSAQEAHLRILPQTLTDLMVWASNTLGEGAILTDTQADRAFSREFGGYSGLPRTIDYTDSFLSRSAEDWLAAGYRYVEMQQEDAEALQRIPEGRAALAPLLELRRFPPPESTEEWNGRSFVLYQIGQPQTPLHANFGGEIQLVGCDCPEFETVTADDTLEVRLYWQASQTPSANYSVFLHVYPEDSDALVAQADGAPAQGNRPTRTWVFPSETLVSDTFRIPLGGSLAPGTYRLVAGLYDYETGERLTTPEGDHTLLGTFTLE